MKYYIVELDPSEMKVQIEPFSATQMEEANARYILLERQAESLGGTRQVVLVSVDSIQALRQAYPNYFLDTTRFVSSIRKIAADYQRWGYAMARFSIHRALNTGTAVA